MSFTYNNFILEEATKSNRFKVVQSVETKGMNRVGSDIKKTIRELESLIN